MYIGIVYIIVGLVYNDPFASSKIPQNMLFTDRSLSPGS